MESSPPEGYRKNAGICLINSSKQVFVASRLDIPDAWLPQLPFWLTYDFPTSVREKIRHQRRFHWKGQAQKWFLLKLTGGDNEINLSGDGTEKPEFGHWSWMPPERVIELEFRQCLKRKYVLSSGNA